MMRAHVNLKGIATLGLTVLAVSILTSCGLTENTQADDKKEVVTESTELPEAEKRFGVDNMTKLFLDFGTSYRTEYEKQYGANQ